VMNVLDDSQEAKDRSRGQNDGAKCYHIVMSARYDGME
jgi:hypothetical protein